MSLASPYTAALAHDVPHDPAGAGPAALVAALETAGLLDDVSSSHGGLVARMISRRRLVLERGDPLCLSGELRAVAWILMRGDLVGDDGIALAHRPVIDGEALCASQGLHKNSLFAGPQGAELLEISLEKLAARPDLGMVVWRNLAALAYHSPDLTRRRGTDGIERDGLSADPVVSELGVADQGAASPTAEIIELPQVSEAVVMFSDVIGFSELMRAAPDEATLAIMDCLRRQSEIILASGGRIDKIMGDGILAYWPVADGARESACKAALEAAIEAENAVRWTDMPFEIVGRGALAIRVGIHVGQVRRGSFGHPGIETILGETVNTAARLEQARESEDVFGILGSIRVSGAFYEALPDFERSLLPNEGYVVVKGEAFTLHSSPENL